MPTPYERHPILAPDGQVTEQAAAALPSARAHGLPNGHALLFNGIDWREWREGDGPRTSNAMNGTHRGPLLDALQHRTHHVSGEYLLTGPTYDEDLPWHQLVPVATLPQYPIPDPRDREALRELAATVTESNVLIVAPNRNPLVASTSDLAAEGAPMSTPVDIARGGPAHAPATEEAPDAEATTPDTTAGPEVPEAAAAAPGPVVD